MRAAEPQPAHASVQLVLSKLRHARRLRSSFRFDGPPHCLPGAYGRAACLAPGPACAESPPPSFPPPPARASTHVHVNHLALGVSEACHTHSSLQIEVTSSSVISSAPCALQLPCIGNIRQPASCVALLRAAPPPRPAQMNTRFESHQCYTFWPSGAQHTLCLSELHRTGLCADRERMKGVRV